MLPTITGAGRPARELAIQFFGASRVRSDARTASRLQCVSVPGGQDDPARALEAAARCQSCPAVSACLLEGMRLDAAWRCGDDPWGAYGCWGGVWFSPGHAPTVLTPGTYAYDYHPSQPGRAA